ncbi:hypothetical protein WK03_35180 [Burkholderia cepacia]|uniref:hypothetical protein n=1 Tax=Burkholderia cepacia TaxID=292 RepID=UPI00075A3B17|nr:hypothetical protein [Burkholderia cepacia]KVQ35713.1 hypothetical protein WK03_35180 [Burkholderia cepacia]
MTPDQREQLEFIERCDPSFLILHVKERTMFDSEMLKKVFELAKTQARSMVGTPESPLDDWTDASVVVPDDEREVIVFLNGHCTLNDWDGRKGGGWGIRLGFYDHERRYWRVHGCRENFVTHWQDEPAAPPTAVATNTNKEIAS